MLTRTFQDTHSGGGHARLDLTARVLAARRARPPARGHDVGIVRQLAPLERIGLVTRESNPTDARLALVVLTPGGAEVADEATVTANEAAAAALGRLWSPEERDALAPLLRRATGD